jgi:hypothetical protein
MRDISSIYAFAAAIAAAIMTPGGIVTKWFSLWRPQILKIADELSRFLPWAATLPAMSVVGPASPTASPESEF